MATSKRRNIKDGRTTTNNKICNFNKAQIQHEEDKEQDINFKISSHQEEK